MPKGAANKRYTAEFKKQLIETMLEEKLSYHEACRRFEVSSRERIKSWERIYLTEGPKALPLSGEDVGARDGRRSSFPRR